MILKQTRVLVGDGEAFGKYLQTLKKGEDISIEVLYGNPDLVRLNDVVAAAHKRTYGNRHIIVSPGELLTSEELNTVLEELRKEFNVPDESFARRIVVRHEKERDGDGIGREFHYHIAIPEVSRDGSILDIAHDYIRNEVVARKLEIIFGHDITPGAWNPQVLERLDTETFYIPANEYDESLYVEVPFSDEMTLEEEFEAFSADENNEIRVRYNTEALENALYDACIDRGMSDEQAYENYASYRAFSSKKTAYVEATKRLGIDLDALRSEFSKIIADALVENANLQSDEDYFATIASQIDSLISILDLKLIYNEPTRVMFVSALTSTDGIQRTHKIGTLRIFLGISQTQFEPILSKILEGTNYDKTDEKPTRYIERSKGPRNIGQDHDNIVSDARGWDGFGRWRESLSGFNRSDREAAPGLGDEAKGNVADDQRTDASAQSTVISYRFTDESDKKSDEDTAGDDGLIRENTEQTRALEFNRSGIQWLLMRSSAKLRQISGYKPMEFKKPLVVGDGSLPEVEFEAVRGLNA